MRYLKIIALAMVTLLATSDSRGQELSPELQKLMEVDIVAFGGVGFAGRISEAEIAFQKILAHDQAVEMFNRLTAEAKPAGQVYALYGLYLKDREAFKQRLTQVRAGIKKDQKILVQTGCTITSEDADEVIKKTESDIYNSIYLQHLGITKKK